MSEIMDNEDRADRALRALEAYLGSETERIQLINDPNDEDLQHEVTAEVIGDLLCDLHHLADRSGVDMEIMFENGRGAYDEEVAEEQAANRVGNVAQSEAEGGS